MCLQDDFQGAISVLAMLKEQNRSELKKDHKIGEKKPLCV
jgi:hypothetical protein